MTTLEPQVQLGDSPWERRHRLSRALENVGWLVKDMQNHLGVSDTAMTGYMQGYTKRMSDGTLRAWAAATHTRWEWLKDGTGPWRGDSTDGPNRPSGKQFPSSRSSAPSDTWSVLRQAA